MQKYPVEELITFIETVMKSFDVPEEDARVTAERMIESDLIGQRAHGIFRLPPYVQRLENGGYNVKPAVKALRENPVSAMVDGDNGLGQVVMTKAAEMAAEKAKSAGMAWVGVRNSNHAGAGGVYASFALKHDLIGIYMAVGSANHMPPWGGTDFLLSTNPLAIAIPAGSEPPFLFDMATTAASYGKIKVAAERGESIPVGWLEDKTGNPITDPKRSNEGFLMPIGEYKGYGLSLAIGILAGVINGAAFGSDVVNFNADYKTKTNTGHSILMVNPALFGDVDTFKNSMDQKILEMKGSKPMEGRGPVRIPGDQIYKRQDIMKAEGIEISDILKDKLSAIATQRKIRSNMFS